MNATTTIEMDIQYNPRTDSYRSQVSGEETPTSTVVKLVCDVRNVGVTELPPLNDTLDPDALNALLSRSSSGVDRIEFDYADCSVTMYGDGRVDLTPGASSGTTGPTRSD